MVNFVRGLISDEDEQEYDEETKEKNIKVL